MLDVQVIQSQLETLPSLRMFTEPKNQKYHFIIKPSLLYFQQLKATLTLSSFDKDTTPIVASVLVIFINKALIKEKSLQASAVGATGAASVASASTTSVTSTTNVKNVANGVSPNKGVKSRINVPITGQYSPLRGGSPNKKNTLTPSRGASSPGRVNNIFKTNFYI